MVIGGPTATGKSGLAIALAQQLNSSIISADSRLVYREFNIGTAKPSATEQQQVPHYLIDICEPTETLTLAEYQRQARSAIGCIPAPALLVGGTGLYIRSIVKGLKIPQVPPHAELRSQLRSLGQSQCYEFLRQVDPASALKIHANDPVRTLRALEVFYVTGQPISRQQGEDPPRYPILQIGLDCFEPEALERRIAQRTQDMVAAGFVAEVEALAEKYGDLPLLKTLGYREIGQYLAGEIDLEAAKALTVLHTRQFAKQQRTWFRADPAIAWFDSDSPDLFAKVWDHVQRFLTQAL
ncbi:MAG: tRNA (adenosine(37)-N6)-dimethylallyltransferase MiaA [Leptolyngbyaceae cyanobacterium CSU_1_4]|nr:tRNA (adenosine(37)-N6)-dimethylallyltransferase MiaA [Leptolyngbyaceae cyanobacterium CSU_1_4]